MKKYSNITERKSKSGKISYQVQIKYHDIYGIERRYTKTHKTLKEAKQDVLKMKIKLSEDYQQEQKVNKTFKEVFIEFLENEKKSYGHNTLYNTKRFQKRLDNDIGDVVINKFDYLYLQKYFNTLGENNSLDTCKGIYKTINRIMVYSIKASYIKENPLTYVKISGTKVTRKGENDIQVVTREQFESIVEYIKNSRANQSYVLAIYLAYMAGLRPGEICGLKFDSIDFQNDTIKVEATVHYKGLKSNEIIVSDKLKTAHSKAVLPLSAELKQILLEWRDINPYEFVVVTVDGAPVNPDVLGSFIHSVAKKLNMPGLTMYTLRHSFITNLSLLNIDMKTFQDLCRHNNIATSYQYYVHSDLEKKRNAISQVFSDNSIIN